MRKEIPTGNVNKLAVGKNQRFWVKNYPLYADIRLIVGKLTC